ncbi:MAG: response regulator [Desulfomonilia bacterium]|jgi:CheY-like chemotaxis protein|nr:response regulator [Desulfomonilia bacterium]HPW69106.1 response regulator [Deltaproteobacteria bacterium]
MNKVLIIDDDSGVHSIIHAIIQRKMPDCAFSSVYNGMDGIRAALYEHPDAILLDVDMPGIDGFETCRRLKGDERTRHIPVVMFSGMATDADSVDAALESGADMIIAKPLRSEHLIRLFRSLLAK